MPSARFPHVFIVGTPRSGTTLVQKTLGDLGIPSPPETHFFPLLVSPWLRARRRDPEKVVANYLATPQLMVHQLDRYPHLADELIRALAASDIGRAFSQLYGCVLDSHGIAADGVVAEKTPDHLRWWPVIDRIAPTTRFVVVVRDPRGVVASLSNVPWGAGPAAISSRWLVDSREVRRCVRHVGSSRCTVVRFEELVQNTEAVRRRLSEELDLSAPTTSRDPAVRLYGEREHWKQKTMEPIDPERARGWARELALADQRKVAAICWDGMVRLGYDPTVSHKVRATTLVRALDTHDKLAVLRNQLDRTHEQWKIRRIRHSRTSST